MKKLLVALFSLIIISCVQTKQSENQPKTPVVSQPDIFSHQLHFQKKSDLSCTDCHSYNPELSDFQRPAHQACAKCHSTKDFKSTDASDVFCQNCHAGPNYNLHIFPINGKGSIVLADFNHQSHLHPSQANQEKFGVTVNCVSCHELDDNVENALAPTHKQCIGCHGASGGASPAKPSLMPEAQVKDCLGCHIDIRQ